MSDSHHVTTKDLRGFTKNQIDEMANEKDSILHKYVKKLRAKKEAKAKRRIRKNK